MMLFLDFQSLQSLALGMFLRKQQKATISTSMISSVEPVVGKVLGAKGNLVCRDNKRDLSSRTSLGMYFDFLIQLQTCVNDHFVLISRRSSSFVCLKRLSLFFGPSARYNRL